MSQLQQGPVASILSATDVFIDALAELGTDLDEARTAIDAFERRMREFRKTLAVTFAEVNRA